MVLYQRLCFLIGHFRSQQFPSHFTYSSRFTIKGRLVCCRLLAGCILFSFRSIALNFQSLQLFFCHSLFCHRSWLWMFTGSAHRAWFSNFQTLGQNACTRGFQHFFHLEISLIDLIKSLTLFHIVCLGIFQGSFFSCQPRELYIQQVTAICQLFCQSCFLAFQQDQFRRSICQPFYLLIPLCNGPFQTGYFCCNFLCLRLILCKVFLTSSQICLKLIPKLIVFFLLLKHCGFRLFRFHFRHLGLCIIHAHLGHVDAKLCHISLHSSTL